MRSDQFTVSGAGDTAPTIFVTGATGTTGEAATVRALRDAAFPSNSTVAPKSETASRLTTLDPGNGYITTIKTINTYTVAPERAEEVLDYLIHSAVETVRYVPGFVSMNFHMSLDRTQIVNYVQWKSREALTAARENPKIVALMSETAKIVDSSKPIPYELRESVAAAGL